MADSAFPPRPWGPAIVEDETMAVVDARIDPSSTAGFRVAVLAASLGAVVGIVVELAIPGQGGRIGLSLAGIVAASFAFLWAVRALAGSPM